MPYFRTSPGFSSDAPPMSENTEPVVIPHAELSADALAGVVESFVLREGTDYGEQEYSLAAKVAHVIRQLERGEAQIVFDATTESVDIVRVRPTPSRTTPTPDSGRGAG